MCEQVQTKSYSELLISNLSLRAKSSASLRASARINYRSREAIAGSTRLPTLDYRLSTTTLTPSECEVNSGAYMLCMVVMPLENSPAWVAKRVYSNR